MAKITDNPGVYEGRVEFRHIQVRLITSNELLLDCGPLLDWLRKKQCIYTVDNENEDGDALSLPTRLGITEQD